MSSLKKAKDRLSRMPGIRNKIALLYHWGIKFFDKLVYSKLLHEQERIEELYYRLSHDRTFAEEFARENFLPIDQLPWGARVLDVGCGRGRISLVFSMVNGVDIVAFDLNRNPFWRNTQKATFLVSEATCLPFANSSFDLCTCMTVLEEIADDKNAVREIYRVLKHAGTFVIQAPNRDNLRGKLTRRKLYAKHVREYDFDEIRSLVEEEGFKVSGLGSIGFYSPILTRLVNNLLSRKTWISLGQMLPAKYRGVIWLVCEK